MRIRKQLELFLKRYIQILTRQQQLNQYSSMIDQYKETKQYNQYIIGCIRQ